MNGLFPSGCHTDRRKRWCRLNTEFLRLPGDNRMCIWVGMPKCKWFLLIPNVCKFMLLGWQRHYEWYCFSIVLYNWNFCFILTMVKYNSCWISMTFPAAPKLAMGLLHQRWKIPHLPEWVRACLSPKGLDCLLPTWKYPDWGQGESGWSMTQQKRGVLVQFGGAGCGAETRDCFGKKVIFSFFNIESFFSPSGNYITSQIQGQRIQTGCEREGFRQ